MLKCLMSQWLSALVIGASLSVVGAPALAQADKVTVAIGVKPGASASVRSDVQRAGGRIVQEMSAADMLVVELPVKAIQALSRNKNVDFVDRGALRTIQGSRSIRVDLSNGQEVPYGIPMVQADQVSDSAAGNRTVCIVDSGIDGGHPDLAGVPMNGENLTKSGEWNTDENSHGTHVAGTIVALSNQIGVVGVAPSGKLNLYIAKVFDASGTTSSVTVARAMLNCWTSGAHIVSMSLGGEDVSPAEARVAALLAKKGLLLVAAAGNAGNNTVSYPAGFPEVVSVAGVDSNKNKYASSQFNPDVELTAPAVNVLSTVPAFSEAAASLMVGASSYSVEAMDGSPRISASGPLADFGIGGTSAPGSMTGKVCLIQRGQFSFAQKVVNCQASGGVGAVIYNNTTGALFGTLGTTVTSIPSVGATQADGATMLTQLGASASVVVFGLPDQYGYKSGTSMATPHVSGVAAVVWSLHTGCTAEQIRASLDKSADDLGTLGRDDVFGFGLVQAKAAHDRITALGCGN